MQAFARVLDGKGLLRDGLSAERARAGLLEANPRKRVDILGHDPHGVDLPVNGVANESVMPFTATPMASLHVVELAAGFVFYLAHGVRNYVCAARRFGNMSTSNLRNQIGRIALWRHHTSFYARLASSTENIDILMSKWSKYPSWRTPKGHPWAHPDCFRLAGAQEQVPRRSLMQVNGQLFDRSQATGPISAALRTSRWYF